jgi:hypothetical protein
LVAYLHPIAGGVVLLLLVYVASLGLRLRTRPRERARVGPIHARFGRMVAVLVLLIWVSGLASTLWLRADLQAGASFHFRTGTVMALLLTGSWLTARALEKGDRRARAIHPWLGAAAALLAAAQAVTGLRITP